jgi:hypothetical protein
VVRSHQRSMTVSASGTGNALILRHLEETACSAAMWRGRGSSDWVRYQLFWWRRWTTTELYSVTRKLFRGSHCRTWFHLQCRLYRRWTIESRCGKAIKMHPWPVEEFILPEMAARRARHFRKTKCESALLVPVGRAERCVLTERGSNPAPFWPT